MADSGEDVVLLKKIQAIHKVNEEIIERLKAAQSSPRHTITATPQISPVFSTDVNKLVSLETRTVTSTAAEVIEAWNPPKTEEFKSSPELNFFNDNIDYGVKTLDDLIRLNSSISTVSAKYGYLDAKKTPPMLRMFLHNIEVVQTLLGDLESSLVERPDPELAFLEKEAAEIISRATKWLERAKRWQQSHGNDLYPTPRLKLSGDNGGILEENGRVLKKVGGKSRDQVALSVDPLTVPTAVRIRVDSLSPVFIGVTSNPATVSGHDDKGSFGWATNGTTWQAGSLEDGSLNPQAGMVVTLIVQPRRLVVSFSKPTFTAQMDLPEAVWYLVITTEEASITIL